MFDWLLFLHRMVKPKKVCQFHLSWPKKDRLIPGMGLEISQEYLVFATAVPPVDKSFEIEFILRSKTLRAFVNVMKIKLVSAKNSYHYEFVCKIIGISADDSDTISRFIYDLPEAKFDGPFVQPTKHDDDFRALPLVAQQQIVTDLVKKGRLGQPDADVAPLIKIVQQSPHRELIGEAAKKVIIHSRIVEPNESGVRNYQTRYVINRNGTVRNLPGDPGLVFSGVH